MNMKKDKIFFYLNFLFGCKIFNIFEQARFRNAVALVTKVLSWVFIRNDVSRQF